MKTFRATEISSPANLDIGPFLTIFPVKIGETSILNGLTRTNERPVKASTTINSPCEGWTIFHISPYFIFKIEHCQWSINPIGALSRNCVDINRRGYAAVSISRCLQPSLSEYCFLKHPLPLVMMKFLPISSEQPKPCQTPIHFQIRQGVADLGMEIAIFNEFD